LCTKNKFHSEVIAFYNNEDMATAVKVIQVFLVCAW